MTTLQHFNDPLHCWVNGEFSGNHEKYTDLACWVSNTYVQPIDDPIPRETPHHQKINYYQWIPLFIVMQAVFFYLPHLLWGLLYPRGGLDINDVVTAAKGLGHFEKGSKADKKKSFEFIVEQMHDFLTYYRPRSKTFCKTKCTPWGLGKRHGNFLIFLYIFIKVLYLLNAVLQLFVQNWFLESDFSEYGINLMRSWIHGTENPSEHIFPLTTLCNFEIRKFGDKVHPYTVQCVLPINFYNEKIYAIMWFWLVVTIVFNACSLLKWLTYMIKPSLHFAFVHKYLRYGAGSPDNNNKDSPRYRAGSLDNNNKDSKEELRTFVHDYLRNDGVLTLRLMQENVNSLLTSEVVQEIHKRYENYRPSSTSSETFV